MSNPLTRRSLLRAALVTPAAVGIVPVAAFARPQGAPKTPDVGQGPFALGPLPYPYNALEPHIDAMTMEIHHDRHHATYVKNLNDFAAKSPEVAKMSAVDLVKNLDKLPEAIRTGVRNNAGGHLNHTMFWEIMKPRGGGEPTGPIADGIKGTFGSFDKFQTAFNDAGAKRFGSGWVWLVRTKDGKMEIVTTPNQDNPIMDGHYPILGNDVWEHAYYLKYQNKRADYLKAWWNTVNWEAVNKRLAEAK
jgi:superoxide dismutase, Fe-Mn family